VIFSGDEEYVGIDWRGERFIQLDFGGGWRVTTLNNKHLP
jgi:hypothetical protein